MIFSAVLFKTCYFAIHEKTWPHQQLILWPVLKHLASLYPTPKMPEVGCSRWLPKMVEQFYPVIDLSWRELFKLFTNIQWSQESKKLQLISNLRSVLWIAWLLPCLLRISLISNFSQLWIRRRKTNINASDQSSNELTESSNHYQQLASAGNVYNV